MIRGVIYTLSISIFCIDTACLIDTANTGVMHISYEIHIMNKRSITQYEFQFTTLRKNNFNEEKPETIKNYFLLQFSCFFAFNNL